MTSALPAAPARLARAAARLGEARRPASAAALVALLILVGDAYHLSWATRGLPSWPPVLAGFGLAALPLCAALVSPPALAGVLVIVSAVIPILGFSTVDYLHVSPFGTISLWLLGAAILVQASRTQSRSAMRHVVVDTIGVLAVVPATVALLSLLFARPELTSLGSSPLSFYGAVTITLLVAAVLAREPDGTLGWIRRGRDPGALLLRRLVPATFLLLPLLAFARLGGQRLGWFGLDVGTSIMTVGAMIIVAISCLIVARQLRRTDLERAAAMRALQLGNDELDREVHRRVEELSVARHRADLAQDRERISADLHDLVIQRLYGAALSLQVRSDAREVMTREDAELAIAAIDDAIAELRGAIFNLRSDTPVSGLKKALAEAVDVAEAAGLVTRLEINGSMQSLPPAVTVHLTAVIREAVSNAARHSGGTWLTIKVVVSREDVTLLIVDDGRGLDPEVEAPSGLRNIRARAADVGGHATWAANVPAGTRVTWVAPLLQGAGSTPSDRMTDGHVAAAPDEIRVVDTAAMRLALAGAPPTDWSRWPLPAGNTAVSGDGSDEVADDEGASGSDAGDMVPGSVRPVPQGLVHLARLVRATFAADRLAIVTEVVDDCDLLAVSYCEDFPYGSRGLSYGRDSSLVARSLATDQCLVFTHVATASATGSKLVALSDGSALIVPLVAGVPGDGTSLALTLLRDHDQSTFTSEDKRAAHDLVRALRPLLLGRQGHSDGDEFALLVAPGR